MGESCNLSKNTNCTEYMGFTNIHYSRCFTAKIIDQNVNQYVIYNNSEALIANSSEEIARNGFAR